MIQTRYIGHRGGERGYLQRHAVDNELHSEVLSVGGHAVLECRLGGVVLAVLVDEVPQDFVEHGFPNCADVVDFVES